MSRMKRIDIERLNSSQLGRVGWFVIRDTHAEVITGDYRLAARKFVRGKPVRLCGWATE